MYTKITHSVNEVIEYHGHTFDSGHGDKFRTKSNNMNSGKLNDVEPGYLLLSQEIALDDLNSDLDSSKYGYIILTGGNSYHRDIKYYNAETNQIICSSRNPGSESNNVFLFLDQESTVFKVVKIHG